MSTRGEPTALLLGEWACLGILCQAPAHGFAVSARLRPDGDVGRVWSMSRALTYRALDQLDRRGLVRPLAEEPGIAGGKRTILEATRPGHAVLRRWLDTPVEHLRDLRSELLLKIVLGDLLGIDRRTLLDRQREVVAHLAEHLAAEYAGSAAPEPVDVVALWRAESSQAALRFLDELLARRSG